MVKLTLRNIPFETPFGFKTDLYSNYYFILHAKTFGDFIISAYNIKTNKSFRDHYHYDRDDEELFLYTIIEI